MEPRRDFPWMATLLALAGAAAIGFSTGEFFLAAVVFALWFGSFWIVPAESREAVRDANGLDRVPEPMREIIERSSSALLLTDRNRIVLANEPAREVLGRHVLGQDARIALRHPAAVALLDAESDGQATIGNLTGPRSVWLMRRSAISNRFWLVELINRTAEADISRAHTDFVANASHELRTPLASIIGYVETLAEPDNAVDDATRTKFMETVLREARRLQALVSDLMSLSRIEAEKHELPEQALDLSALVARAARDAGRPEDKERLQLDMAEAGPIMVRGDREQLEQLVRNLVDNGLKYGDNAKPVTVAVVRDGSARAVLTVRDRGEGISRDHLPHLTRRFYRTDPGRSRMAGGTGLGLAIVKHIVERHRGRLDIDSEPGEGTVVTVKIPALEQQAIRDHSPEESAPTSH